MLSLLLVALCCSAALANHREISQPPTDATIHWEPHILGGADANDKEFPYIVSLNYVGDGHACGASILTPNFVLTAAHCCLTGNALNVFAGSIDLNGSGQTIDIEKYLVHGDYDPDNHWRNDICVIKLRSSLQYNDRVKPVTLPASNLNVPTGAALTVIGWGVTSNEQGGRPPNRLQVLRTYKGLSNSDCKAASGLEPYDGQICGQGSQNHGVCSGDSGGPVSLNGVQVGLASFVFLPCGSGAPDFYTRVSFYIGWIQQVLGSEAEHLQFAA